MRQLVKVKIGAILLMVLAGCQKMKPESVNIPEYPDLKELMLEQADLLQGVKITKEVMLGSQTESNEISMDSVKWIEELSFLKEMNPNQPEYVGAFEKTEGENLITLNLKKQEQGALKKVSFIGNQNVYETIQISFHEDKDIYIHHREITMNFDSGKLTSLEIDGYQKMISRDTVRFGINIRIK